MIRVAVKSLSTRRLRTVLTAFAIVLGVAMVSGAYTLTDTMGAAADSLSKASYNGTDAVVTTKTAVERTIDDEAPPPPVAASALERVKDVPGVGSAAGSISDEARIIGKDGKVEGTGPYFGVGYDAAAASGLAPFKVKDGRFATGPGQVVIDAGTAKKNDLAVGDKVRIQPRGPVRTFEITGIATFGDVDSLGPATFAVFDLRAAPAAVRPAGRPTTRSWSRATAASPAPRCASGSPASCRARSQVQTAAKQDRFMLDGLKTFVVDPADHLRGLRRRGDLRGRVHDL